MPDVALVGLGGAGLIAGLGMLVRGFLAQRAAARIDDVATSRIATLAAGEVRITGQAQAAGVTLASSVRGRPCLYYRATARVNDGETERTLFDEQRGIGFFVKDGSGEIRIFPRGARWDVTLDEPTPWAEGRAGAGGSLLVTAGPDEDPLHPDRDDLDFAMPMLMASATQSGGSRQVMYREGRIEAGDTVTVVGRALPFRDLADPTEVDEAGDSLVTLTGAVDSNHVPDPRALDDPEVAASYGAALRDGTLTGSPTEAWGNAAIEGFGIGRPVRPPELDPGVAPPPNDEPRFGGPAASANPGVSALATGLVAPALGAALAVPALSTTASAPATVPRSAAAMPTSPDPVERSFELPPDALVLASGPDGPLVIAAGTPVQAVARQEGVFLMGLLGAVLAIASAIFLAVVLGGTLGLP